MNNDNDSVSSLWSRARRAPAQRSAALRALAHLLARQAAELEALADRHDEVLRGASWRRDGGRLTDAQSAEARRWRAKALDRVFAVRLGSAPLAEGLSAISRATPRAELALRQLVLL